MNANEGAYEMRGFRDAADAGFRPDATGAANREALQRAVDRGGTVVVSRPGTYALAGTVYVGSDTTLVFGAGVFVKKVDERGPFTHVLLNKGALTRTWDERIAVHGLHVIVNGVDVRTFEEVFGLHGQIAFFYVRDLKITGFRCMDLGKVQFAVHICTFEDVIVDDVIVRGMKDGVHLGRGRRFTIRNGVFQTYDDAVALNAHDYDVSNPELGWIEHGIVEKCWDLNQPNTTGYFCRMLAGAWTDWTPGMEVQKSDTVVSEGRLYRVRAEPDGKAYVSTTRPTHEKGGAVLDGIRWEVVPQDVTYTAGVRNVVFRDIFLEKPRTAFSIHFDADRFSRSFYPGAARLRQENLCFENVSVLYDQPMHFLSVNTPVDELKVYRSRLRNSRVHFRECKAVDDFGPTRVLLDGCTFAGEGEQTILSNAAPGKRVKLTTHGSTVLSEAFRAKVEPGEGTVEADADLPGLG